MTSNIAILLVTGSLLDEDSCQCFTLFTGIITIVWEKVANSIHRVMWRHTVLYTHTGRVYLNTTVYKPCIRLCTRPFHRRVYGQVDGLYTAVYTVVYTAVYTGRVHGRLHVITCTQPCKRPLHHRVHGPCTQPCTRRVCIRPVRPVYTAAYMARKLKRPCI